MIIYLSFAYFFVFLVLVFVTFYIAYSADLAFGDADLATSPEVIKQVAVIIRQKNLEQACLFDLGSCRGNFVLKILDIYPSLKVYGVDNSLIRIILARIRALFHPGHPVFTHQDIFITDLSKADIVFIYLEQSLVFSIEEKLSKELKPGAVVIINNTHFASWPNEALYFTDKNNQKRGRVFVYRKN